MNINPKLVRSSLIRELADAKADLEEAIQTYEDETGRKITIAEPFYVEPALVVYVDNVYLGGYSRPDPSDECAIEEYNTEELGVEMWASLLSLMAQDIRSGEIFEAMEDAQEA